MEDVVDIGESTMFIYSYNILVMHVFIEIYD